jgi:hypothetical protein
MQALGYVSQRHNGHLSYLTFDHCYSVNLQQVSRQPIGKPTIPTASPKRAVKSIEKPRICASETYIHKLGGAARSSSPVFRALGSCESCLPIGTHTTPCQTIDRKASIRARSTLCASNSSLARVAKRTWPVAKRHAHAFFGVSVNY